MEEREEQFSPEDVSAVLARLRNRTSQLSEENGETGLEDDKLVAALQDTSKDDNELQEILRDLSAVQRQRTIEAEPKDTELEEVRSILRKAYQTKEGLSLSEEPFAPPTDPLEIPEEPEQSFTESILDIISFGQDVQKREDLPEGEERNFRTALQQSLLGLTQSISGLQAGEAAKDLTALETGQPRFITDSGLAGLSRLVQGDEALAEQAKERLQEKVAKVAELEVELRDLPESLAAQEVLEKSILQGEVDPKTLLVGIIDLGASSALQSIPSMVGGIAGAFAGTALAGPGFGTAIGAGIGSTAGFGVEYAASFVDYLERQGVDLSDETAVKAVLADPEFLNEAAGYATTRAAIITGVDATSAAIIGRLAPFSKSLGVFKRLGFEVGEVGFEATTEAAGEAGAIFGASVQEGNSLREALAETIASGQEIKAEGLGALGPISAAKVRGINAAVKEGKQATAKSKLKDLTTDASKDVVTSVATSQSQNVSTPVQEEGEQTPSTQEETRTETQEVDAEVPQITESEAEELGNRLDELLNQSEESELTTEESIEGQRITETLAQAEVVANEEEEVEEVSEPETVQDLSDEDIAFELDELRNQSEVGSFSKEQVKKLNSLIDEQERRRRTVRPAPEPFKIFRGTEITLLTEEGQEITGPSATPLTGTAGETATILVDGKKVVGNYIPTEAEAIQQESVESAEAEVDEEIAQQFPAVLPEDQVNLFSNNLIKVVSNIEEEGVEGDQLAAEIDEAVAEILDSSTTPADLGRIISEVAKQNGQEVLTASLQRALDNRINTLKEAQGIETGAVEESPVEELPDTETVQQEIDAIDERIGALEAKRDERESGDFTERELDQVAELEEKREELLAKLPETESTREDDVAQLQEWADFTESQPNMGLTGLRKTLSGLEFTSNKELERLLTVDKEVKILDDRTKRAIRKEIKERTPKAPVVSSRDLGEFETTTADIDLDDAASAALADLQDEFGGDIFFDGEDFFDLDGIVSEARSRLPYATDTNIPLVSEGRRDVLKSIISNKVEEPATATYGYRADATEEVIQQGRDALEDLESVVRGEDGRTDFIYDRRGTTSVSPEEKLDLKILGRGIGKQLDVKGTASLVGRKIVAPEDLAALAQIYRDKRFETIRFFFTKGDTVVGEMAMSSRMPSTAMAFDMDAVSEIQKEFFPTLEPHESQGYAVALWMKGLMRNYGADGYYLLHNHPSGAVGPSKPDIETTAFYAKVAKGFKGHVIIDTGVASVMEVGTSDDGERVLKQRGFQIEDVEALKLGGVEFDAETGDYKDELRDPSIPNPVLGFEMTNEKDVNHLVAVVKHQEKSLEDSDSLVLIGTNARYSVNFLAAIPKTSVLWKTAKGLHTLLAELSSVHGVTNWFLGGVKPTELVNFTQFVQNSVFIDVTDTTGDSLVRRNIYPIHEFNDVTNEVRFSEDAGQYATVKWVDEQGRQRHTEKDLTMDELVSKKGYQPENAEKTQIKTTVATYEKAADFLTPGDKVLDFGGGLGFGTEVLRQKGFEVDLFEPFSNPERRQTAPDFVNAEDITGKYDKVISSAVLNVVPQDIRTSIISKIGQVLAYKGEAIITTRGWKGDVATAARNGTELGNQQVITSRGTYQKGFAFEQLAQEIQDVLGKGFSVHRLPLGNVGVRVVKHQRDTTAPSLLFSDSDGFGRTYATDLTLEEAGIEYMVSFIERGVKDLSRMTRIMVDQFGEGIRDHVKGWFRAGLAKMHDRRIPIQVLEKSPIRVSKFIKDLSLTKATNIRNAEANFRKLDVIKGLHEDTDGNLNILEDEGSFLTYMTRVKGDESVPVAPTKAIEYFNSQEALKEQLSRISSNARRDASFGLDVSREIYDAYTSGQVHPSSTLQYILWGILSRGLSPYPHESAFIDAILDKGNYFIEKALAGKFDANEYKKWSGKVLKGLPGAQGTANLNAFGKTTLDKMISPIESGPYEGRRPIDVLHEMLSDPKMTGREIRREFYKIVEKPGIDTKVFSFLLLLTGRHDVLVLDRVQMSHLWDVDNRQDRFMTKNAYDGYKIPSGEQDLSDLSDELLEDAEGGNINKTGMVAFTFGGQGIALYEALEESLESKIKEAYASIGVEDGTVGRFHWETWLLQSGQEVDHRSLVGLGRSILGAENAYEGVSARQGKFDTYHYDTVYAIMNGERVHIVTDPEGNQRVLSIPDYRAYVDGLSRMDKLKSYYTLREDGVVKVFSTAEYKRLTDAQKSEAVYSDDNTTFIEQISVDQGDADALTDFRIFPYSFQVSKELNENGESVDRKNTPWRLDERVSQGALGRYVQGFGREITEGEVATLSGATNESRQTDGRRRIISVEEGRSLEKRAVELSSQLSANPFGNPELWGVLFKLGLFYAQETGISFLDWSTKMKQKVGESVTDAVLSKLWHDIQRRKERLRRGATIEEVVEESFKDLPKIDEGQIERNFSRRFMGDEEAGNVRDDIDDDVQRIFSGSFFKSHISNQQTIDKIKSIVAEKGFQGAIAEVKDVSNDALSWAEKSALAQLTLLQMNARIKELKGVENKQGERDSLLIQTVDLVEFMAQLGTLLGRGLQSYTMWARLTPEAIILRFKKLKNKSALANRQENEAGDQRILDSVNTANEEAAKKTTSKKAKEISDIISESAKRLAAKIKPTITPKNRTVIDFYVHTLFEIAKERGTNVEVERPEADSPIQKLGKAVRAFADLKEVWEEAQELVVEKFADNPAALSLLQSYLQSELDAPVSNKALRASIKQGLKELEKRISTIAVEHWTKVDVTSRTLAEKIIEDGGVPEADANAIAKLLEDEFAVLVAETRERILKNRVGKRPDRSKKKMKSGKTFYDELFELANLGAVTPEHYAVLLEKYYDIQNPTQEQIDRLVELQEAAQLAPEGDLKAAKSVEIAAYMAKETGMPWSDYLQSYWYANVLSGLGTQTINLAGSAQNLALRTAALLMTKHGREHYRSYFRGMKVGFQQGVAAAKAVLKGQIVTKTENKFEMPRALEIAYKNLTQEEKDKKFSVKKAFLLGRYVGRALQAGDIMFHRTAREARAYLIAGQEVKALESGELTTDEYLTLVDERVNHSQEKVLSARWTAEQEVADVLGDEAQEGDIELRTWEILEQLRDDRTRVLSNEFASLMNFTAESRGTMGWIGDMLQSAVLQSTIGDESQSLIKGKLLEISNRLNAKLDAGEDLGAFQKFYARDLSKRIEKLVPSGIPILRPVFPFIPVLANVFNRGIDFIPIVGHIRAVKGGAIFRHGRQELTAFEKAERLAEASLSFSMAMVFMGFVIASHAIAEDDEEPWMDITAAGPKDFEQRRQWLSQGNKPFSVKIGPIHFTYNETNLGFTFAVLGSAMDNYKETGELDWDTVANVFMAAPSVIANSTFLRAMKDFMDLTTETNPESVGRKLKQFSRNWTGGLIPAAGLLRDISAAFDPEFRQSDAFVGQVLKDIPILKHYIGLPLRNALGEVVERKGIINRLPGIRRLVGTNEADEVWTFLGRHKVWIKTYNDNVSIKPPKTSELEDLKLRQMIQMGQIQSETLSDEDMDKLIVMTGAKVRARLEDVMASNQWEGRSKEYKQTALNQIVSDAKTEARREFVFGPSAVDRLNSFRRRFNAKQRELERRTSRELTTEKIEELIEAQKKQK